LIDRLVRHSTALGLLCAFFHQGFLLCQVPR